MLLQSCVYDNLIFTRDAADLSLLVNIFSIWKLNEMRLGDLSGRLSHSQADIMFGFLYLYLIGRDNLTRLVVEQHRAEWTVLWIAALLVAFSFNMNYKLVFKPCRRLSECHEDRGRQEWLFISQPGVETPFPRLVITTDHCAPIIWNDLHLLYI